MLIIINDIKNRVRTRPRPVLMFIPSLVAIHLLVSEKNADKQTNFSRILVWWCFGLSNFVSVIIREPKGLRKRDYIDKCLGPLNQFPGNWFLYDMISWERPDAFHVSNHWLQMVQTIKCKGVNFEENSQQANKLLSQLHSSHKLIIYKLKI